MGHCLVPRRSWRKLLRPHFMQRKGWQRDLQTFLDQFADHGTHRLRDVLSDALPPMGLLRALRRAASCWHAHRVCGLWDTWMGQSLGSYYYCSTCGGLKASCRYGEQEYSLYVYIIVTGFGFLISSPVSSVFYSRAPKPRTLNLILKT